MEELWRVSKPKAKILIYVPHYTGQYAFKYLDHKKFFGVGSMNMFGEEIIARQKYCDATFKVTHESLSFFLHQYHKKDGFIGKLLMCINSFNFLFNFNYMWRFFCERFWVWGFDEIRYGRETVKKF